MDGDRVRRGIWPATRRASMISKGTHIPLTMICAYCDAPMPDVSVYCPVCGHSIARDDFEASELRERLLSALAYFALIPAVIFLIIPPLSKGRYIRFHAWQSLLFSIATLILACVLRLIFLIFTFLPLIPWVLLGVCALGIFILWVVLVVKALQGSGYELPLIGPLAARLATRSAH